MPRKVGNKVSQEKSLLHKEKHQTMTITFRKDKIDCNDFSPTSKHNSAERKAYIKSSNEDLREAEAVLKKKGVSIDSETENEDGMYPRRKIVSIVERRGKLLGKRMMMHRRRHEHNSTT